MEKTADLLLAMELIKRAELLQDRAAGLFAVQERANGSGLAVDVLRGQYKRLHPYQEFLKPALQEANIALEFIAQLNRE